MTDDPSSSRAAVTAGQPVQDMRQTATSERLRESAGSAAASASSGAGWLTRLRGRVGLKAPASLRDDLATALAEEPVQGETATFTTEERRLLGNILRLREVRVYDVMVPRADIDAIDASASLSVVLMAFHQSGHSRMPVYRDTLDDPLGMVHIKDLMAYITAISMPTPAEEADGTADAVPGRPRLDFGLVDLDRSLDATGLIRPVLFVPPSMSATDLMAKMQADHVQMALVIDEYGGTDGLVSLEDLVEEVVGDISDEHDDEEDDVRLQEQGDGVWVADARVALEDVAEILGPGFRPEAVEEEAETLGGLVYAIAGRIPVRGEIISSRDLPGFEFEVLEADPRRIRRLKISRRRPEARAVPERRRRSHDSGSDATSAATTRPAVETEAA
ncbi:hemolysin family protein [Segnochrobactraceae bacterium EtOH-i3]